MAGSERVYLYLLGAGSERVYISRGPVPRGFISLVSGSVRVCISRGQLREGLNL